MYVSPKERLLEFVEVYKESKYELTKKNIGVYLQELINSNYKFDMPYESLKSLAKELKAIDPKFKEQIKKCCDISTPIKPKEQEAEGMRRESKGKEKTHPKVKGDDDGEGTFREAQLLMSAGLLPYVNLEKAQALIENPIFIEIQKAIQATCTPSFIKKLQLVIEELDPKFFEKLVNQVTESKDLYRLAAEAFANLLIESGSPELGGLVRTFENPFENENLNLIYEGLRSTNRTLVDLASRAPIDVFFDIGGDIEVTLTPSNETFSLFLEIEKAIQATCSSLFTEQFQSVIQKLDPKFYEKIASDVTESKVLYRLTAKAFARLLTESGSQVIGSNARTFKNPFEKENLNLIYKGLTEFLTEESIVGKESNVCEDEEALAKNLIFIEIQKAIQATSTEVFTKQLHCAIEILDPKFYKKLVSEVLYRLSINAFARLLNEKGNPELGNIVKTFENPFEQETLNLIYEGLRELMLDESTLCEDNVTFVEGNASTEARNVITEIWNHENKYV